MVYFVANHRQGASLAFLLILSAVSIKAFSTECPEPEDIFPCYCEEEDDTSFLVCNHFWKTDQIYDSVKGLKGHKVSKMSFFMNRILEPVKSEAFSEVAVESIVFENSTISLTSPQFKGTENHLKSIQMRACFNKTNPLGTWSLSHLTNLRELTFDKNRIMTLPDSWLTSAPKSLKSVALEDNSMVTLEDNVFAKIEGLTFLVLDVNRLTSLKRSMFPNPAENLRSISLNYNRLRYLTYDLFSDMPNLRIVEMTNNRMVTLEESIWSVMWSQLSKLDLSDNALECDHLMKWMYAGQPKPILLYGECQSPEKMKGKSLKYLKSSDFS